MNVERSSFHLSLGSYDIKFRRNPDVKTHLQLTTLTSVRPVSLRPRSHVPSLLLRTNSFPRHQTVRPPTSFTSLSSTIYLDRGNRSQIVPLTYPDWLVKVNIPLFLSSHILPVPQDWTLDLSYFWKRNPGSLVLPDPHSVSHTHRRTPMATLYNENSAVTLCVTVIDFS